MTRRRKRNLKLKLTYFNLRVYENRGCAFGAFYFGAGDSRGFACISFYDFKSIVMDFASLGTFRGKRLTKWNRSLTTKEIVAAMMELDKAGYTYIIPNYRPRGRKPVEPQLPKFQIHRI